MISCIEYEQLSNNRHMIDQQLPLGAWSSIVIVCEVWDLDSWNPRVRRVSVTPLISFVMILVGRAIYYR